MVIENQLLNFTEHMSDIHYFFVAYTNASFLFIIEKIKILNLELF